MPRAPHYRLAFHRALTPLSHPCTPVPSDPPHRSYHVYSFDKFIHIPLEKSVSLKSVTLPRVTRFRLSAVNFLDATARSRFLKDSQVFREIVRDCAYSTCYVKMWNMTDR